MLYVEIIFAMRLFCMSLVKVDAYAGTPYECGIDLESRSGTLFQSRLTMLNVRILQEWTDIVWFHFYRQPEILLIGIGHLILTIFGVINVVVGVETEQNLLEHSGLMEELCDIDFTVRFFLVLCMFMPLNLYLALHPRWSILIRTIQVTFDAMFHVLAMYSSEVSIPQVHGESLEAYFIN